MKKSITFFVICICILFTCPGCEKKTQRQTAGEEEKAQIQTTGEDGLVTMSAVQTEDDSITMECTIFNKTEKDIEIGEEYNLQVLRDRSFVDVPLLPEAEGFNLLSREISSGEEYSYKARIEHNYGDLEAGRYRIVKEYIDKEKDSQKKGNNREETVSAEFDLS